ncbi:lipid-A-disaccharide synthase [Chthonobacter rhizosphaerae]|uniref:lipid-A-disaccharide synthase n=1 Tax=Chthonobacter rhizosphaerae TaxID=2735553 RepID=UPI0015EEFAC1|nr:lipid-A-disaccharide synthase [Chthonobacter rhizosphaerae]
MSSDSRPLHVFLVVGEESGDQLGARLMEALIRRTGGSVRFSGLGGSRMQALGLAPLFPLHDIAVMGIGPVLARLPTLVRRVYATVTAALAADPDVMVIIDSPDFTHQVAKRVRKERGAIPIVGYVSPSVWAWRPGRARKMAVYVDHLLAILPFEPEIHARLGGPTTTYVGHPLIDRPDLLLGTDGERQPLATADPPTLLVLPGSRHSEVSRLLEVFGETVGRLAAKGVRFECVIPAVPHLQETITAGSASWAVRPTIVSGEAAKFAAFRRAHAALAASGTVTLELALAGVPMVVAYRLDALFRIVKRIVLATGQPQVSSMVLPNIILGRNVIPEHLDADVTADGLAAAVAPLLADTAERARQVEALGDLWTRMALPGGRSPGDAAADVVLATARRVPGR